MSSIPIVSLKNLQNSNSKISREVSLETAEEFGKALKYMGFVYLTDHGISQEKVNKKNF